jgi:subtilisin family serine protease
MKAKRTAAMAILALAAVALPEPEDIAAPMQQGNTAGSLIAQQQALFERLNVPEAWEVTKGDPKVLVGVIEGGFDFFHPDLKGQLIPGMYYPGGYHTEIFHTVAHGTEVASIIGARDDNPDGMVGLAPGCRVLTASQGMIEHAVLRLRNQFVHDNPGATPADLEAEMVKHRDQLREWGQEWSHYQVDGAAAAIRYLVDGGVRVINLSSAMTRSLCLSAEDWQNLEGAFAYAAGRDVIIVLAAGNNAAQWKDYPGNPETVIVVGATLLNDTRWEEEPPAGGAGARQGSNYGKRLTVMAPVENLVVCMPHEPRFYSCDDGPMGPADLPFTGMHNVRGNGATSCAAPIITSLVALIYSARPTLDARSVVKIVQQGCDDIGVKGYDTHTGYGRANFGRSIKLALDWGE